MLQIKSNDFRGITAKASQLARMKRTPKAANSSVQALLRDYKLPEDLVTVDDEKYTQINTKKYIIKEIGNIINIKAKDGSLVEAKRIAKRDVEVDELRDGDVEIHYEYNGDVYTFTLSDYTGNYKNVDSYEVIEYFVDNIDHNIPNRQRNSIINKVENYFDSISTR